MARNPPGVISRFIPDRYPQRLMSGGGILPNISEFTFGAISLFNNASDGSWLVIWDVTVGYTPVDGDPPMAVARMAYVQGQVGTDAGTVDPQPVVPLSGIGAGLVFTLSDWANPHTEQYQFPMIGAGFQWAHDWPVGYVPPGFSAVVVTDFNACLAYNVNFIWEVTRGF